MGKLCVLLPFHHVHELLGDLDSVFHSSLVSVTIRIVHPANKDRSTKQQGPPYPSVITEACRNGLGNSNLLQAVTVLWHPWVCLAKKEPKV